MIDSEGCAIFIIPAAQAVQWKHFSSYFKKAEWEKKKRNGVRCGGNKEPGLAVPRLLEADRSPLCTSAGHESRWTLETSVMS